MNKMKLWALCLSFILVFGVLQGCGSKSAENTDSKKTEEAERPDPEKRAPGMDVGTSGSSMSEGGSIEGSSVEMSDTIRWFNATYAVLTDLNGWDYNLFGGLEPTESNQKLEQQLLVEWWGVTDRASADETLDWILTEGHRVEFVDTMVYLEEYEIQNVAEDERVDFILEYFDISEEEAKIYADAYTKYETYGENTIAGWDYCRAMNLMGYYYLAGYYTEEEALDKSLEIAETMQPMFDSWDALIDSYMCGYEYWAEESSEERREVYEDLKGREDNPYAVDYQMTLEKTW